LAKESFAAYAACRYFFKDLEWIKSSKGKNEEMVYIVERFILKAECAVDATDIMQRLDDLLGPAAHDHSGWCGHALFLQDVMRPHEILMCYPWRSIELHADLRAQEERRLTNFYAQYCQAPREITIYQPLNVEVEHVHEHGEPMSGAEEKR
jgi:3-oxoacyl-[acyl-carrier protein] reductase